MIKPSREEYAIIRECAKAACRKEGATLFKMEAGQRMSVAEDRTGMEEPSINILQIDKTADWEESDLYTTVYWEDVRKTGIPSDDGRAVVDFYCYARDEGLITNMQAHFDNGKLVWTGIEGPWGFTHWGTLMDYGEKENSE